MSRTLQGKVAVVTGGSRGIGKGIALELGQAGAIVYVTGRTLHEGSTLSPGTILETAAEVTRMGGQGIAIRCDHSHDAEVEALFRRVQEEQGRLDILVNNVFATPPGKMPAGVPFWELPIALWDEFHTVGLRSHYVASVFAAPLMLAQRRGLIVNISSAGAGPHHPFGVAYGVGKAGVDKLTADMAHELRPHGIAVISGSQRLRGRSTDRGSPAG
jgi:dehydrogenase/reductase SDR family protein 1